MTLKRVPLRRISAKQLARMKELPKPKAGLCQWCGSYGQRDNDHIVPRAQVPGENRDHKDNIALACRRCNRRRAEGLLRPQWWKLTTRQQRFVLQMLGAYRARTYFDGVPDEVAEAAAR